MHAACRDTGRQTIQVDISPEIPHQSTRRLDCCQVQDDSTIYINTPKLELSKSKMIRTEQLQGCTMASQSRSRLRSAACVWIVWHVAILIDAWVLRAVTPKKKKREKKTKGYREFQ
ncbi:hypothetical protein B0H19DRAFT_1066445 [Mycena capillaripes]|nr:hypothetical protein B0H19DRAFT_1066445 [Mycena capillaripes]